MKYLKIILTFFFVIGFMSVINAQDKSTEIKSFLENRDKEIKVLVGPEGTEYSDERREELKELINGVIDFEAMGAYALQDTYSTLEESQKNEFVDLFSTIVRDQSLNKLDIYRAKVTYDDITVEGDEANVVTMAELDNIRTPVSYKMVYRSNEWFITDLNIDDVSTAESYKRQFQKILRRKGFDSLMTTLRKRAAKAD